MAHLKEIVDGTAVLGKWRYGIADHVLCFLHLSRVSGADLVKNLMRRIHNRLIIPNEGIAPIEYGGNRAVSTAQLVDIFDIDDSDV